MEGEIRLQGYRGNNLYARWFPGIEGTKVPPLILLHGLGTDSREFGDVPKLLSEKGVSVLTFDYSGHGRSDGKRAYINRQVHVEDTESAIRFAAKEGQGKVYILGHSFGAYAALMAVVDRSEVAGGILVAPQIRSGDSLKGIKRLSFLGIGMFYSLFPFFPDIYVKNHIDYEEIFLDSDAAAKASEIGFIVPSISLKLCTYAMQADNRTYVSRIKKPILFVACGADKQIPIDRVKALSDVAPSQYRHFFVLEESGHSPFLDSGRNNLINKIVEFSHAATC